MKLRSLLLIMTSILNGCVVFQPGIRFGLFPTNSQTTKRVAGQYTLKGANLTVDLPSGWLLNGEDSTGIMIIKDQSNMRIGGFDTYRFRDSKDPNLKKLSNLAGQPPENVAAVLMEELRARQNDLDIIETASTEISKKPGFRVTYSYDTTSWPAKKGVYYGLMVGNWLYHLIYESDFSQFYQNISDVERVKESFSLSM